MHISAVGSKHSLTHRRYWVNFAAGLFYAGVMWVPGIFRILCEMRKLGS